jgi:hypothetical protein
VSLCHSGSRCPHGQGLVNGACTTCAAGRYSLNSSCISCPLGKYNVDSGHSSCVDCSINTYSDQTGSTSCTACPKQSYSAVEGAISLSSCKVQHCQDWKKINNSYYYIDSTKFASWAQAQPLCQALKHGARLAVLNSKEMINQINSTFPVGDYDTFWIGLQESDGYQNYVWVTGESFGLSITEVFYQGYADHSYYNQHCIELFFGTLNDDFCYEAWNYLCEVPSEYCFSQSCNAGQFLDLLVPTTPVCSPCPAGSYQDEEDMLTCIPCAEGSYSGISGQTACSPCELGKYANQSGLTKCFSCPSFEKGHSSTLFSSSKTIDGCVCVDDFYGKPFVGEICQTCDTDIYSCPLNSTKPKLKSGYYLDAATGGVYKCSPSDSCAMTDSSNTTRCGEGYTGFACGSCIALQYYRADGACYKCGSGGVKWALFIIGFSFLAFLIYRLSQWKGNLPLDLRIMFMSLQIIATYPNIANDWPSKISTLLKITSVGNIDLDLVSPGELIRLAIYLTILYQIALFRPLTGELST